MMIAVAAALFMERVTPPALGLTLLACALEVRTNLFPATAAVMVLAVVQLARARLVLVVGESKGDLPSLQRRTAAGAMMKSAEEEMPLLVERGMPAAPLLAVPATATTVVMQTIWRRSGRGGMCCLPCGAGWMWLASRCGACERCTRRWRHSWPPSLQSAMPPPPLATLRWHGLKPLRQCAVQLWRSGMPPARKRRAWRNRWMRW